MLEEILAPRFKGLLLAEDMQPAPKEQLPKELILEEQDILKHLG